MYYVYILKTSKEGYYIGSTNNLIKRLEEHNQGKTVSLRNKRPVNLIYYKKFATRSEAYKRELTIKHFKGGNALKKLLNKTPM